MSKPSILAFLSLSEGETLYDLGIEHCVPSV